MIAPPLSRFRAIAALSLAVFAGTLQAHNLDTSSTSIQYADDFIETMKAIPEPSTYLAAAGLIAVMLWPSRRRLVRDAKKILGLRAPMRDRLAVQRHS